jgi:hypothetical protein
LLRFTQKSTGHLKSGHIRHRNGSLQPNLQISRGSTSVYSFQLWGRRSRRGNCVESHVQKRESKESGEIRRKTRLNVRETRLSKKGCGFPAFSLFRDIDIFGSTPAFGRWPKLQKIEWRGYTVLGINGCACLCVRSNLRRNRPAD